MRGKFNGVIEKMENGDTDYKIDEDKKIVFEIYKKSFVHVYWMI